MNNIKKHLILILSIALCASFHAFAMEKKRSSASGEQFEMPTGEANVSSESGVSELLEEARMEKKNKQQLIAQIKTLQNITEDLNEQLEDFEFTKKEENEIKELLKYIQRAMAMANDMLFGLKPINIQIINQQVETAHSVSQRYFSVSQRYLK